MNLTRTATALLAALFALPASAQTRQTAPAAVPANQPADLAWNGRSGPMVPRSPKPASTLAVLDIRKLSPEWQRASLALQGIVNRKSPSVYCLVTDTDAVWLTRMQQAGYIRKTVTVNGPMDLLRRRRSAIRGVVITDPALPASINVAFMVAAVRDALPVSAGMVKQLGLPVVADLRGKFRTNVQAYSWAFDNLWPGLSHQVLSYSHPSHLMPRDYLVQHKAFQFWVTGPVDGAEPGADPTAEVRLMERLLAKMPANIAVLGYPYAGENVGIQETPGVRLISRYAKYLIATDWDANLSVHSGIRTRPLRQVRPPAPKLDPTKAYVSFIISDGDNLQVYQQHSFEDMWKSPLHGKVPAGWTISPSAARLIPDVAEWFYRNATPADEFVGAVSGIGYIYPDDYAQAYRKADRRRVFNGFLQQTAVGMREMDLDDLWIMGASRQDTIAPYAEEIPGLNAIFPDYGRRTMDYAHATYPTAKGVPVFHCVNDWGGPDHVASQVRETVAGQRPAFVHIFAQNWEAGLPRLDAVMKALGPGFVAVRPDHLATLYRRHAAQTVVQVSAPPEVVAIEGRQTQFPFTLRNLTGKSVMVRLSVSANGATHPLPRRRELPPYQLLEQAMIAPSGSGPVRVSADGPFGRRSASMRRTTLPSAGIMPGLPEGTLHFVGRFDAVDLPHGPGVERPDATALAGRVWAVSPAGQAPGHAVYGPYVALSPGRYVALFRIKRTGEGTGTAASLDVSSDGGRGILASRSVAADDLPDGSWRCVPLPFTYTGGVIETRIGVSGGPALDIDTVLVYRTTP